VLDERKQKIMNVKLYNKGLDLLGREGSKNIGNGLRKVLGATTAKDALQDRIKLAREGGLTRLEISVLF